MSFYGKVYYTKLMKLIVVRKESVYLDTNI
jgi:hypothetical protein